MQNPCGDMLTSDIFDTRRSKAQFEEDSPLASGQSAWLHGSAEDRCLLARIQLRGNWYILSYTYSYVL
jgi:hypothetical protein